jgi:hypothetical protein
MNQNVSALTVYDDGGGPALYAGGSFTTAGGATASRIAKWNGSTWSALSSATFIGANPYIGALTVFDDGGGPALYAGGRFFSTGGPTLNNIAKWNGSSWTPLGSGTSGNFSDVSDLAVFDDGSGPALYAGGFFTTAGGVTVDRIAKWNGSSWSGVGGGMDDYVQALTVHDDGSGSALYAAGRFTVAGGVAANLIARWNGASWSALGSGLNDFVVHALTVFDDGSGPALFAGGDYRSALDSGDSYLAEWGCDTTPPTISSRPTLRVPDRLGTPPGEVVNFSVTATDVHDRSPSISCVPPSGSFFPAGRTLVTCTATDAAGNQSTSQFLVIVAPRVR